MHRAFATVSLPPFASALLLGGVLAAPSLTRADIGYEVKIPPSEDLHVTVTIPTHGPFTEVQSPRWSPGAYIVANNARRIKNFTVADDKGTALTFTMPDDMTWHVVNPKGARKIVIQYDVPVNRLEGATHYSGPATYLYVVGRKTERCHLALDLPPGAKVAIGLDPEGPEGATFDQDRKFVAPTYDVLADSPVTTGDFTLDTYTVDGKLHELAIFGGSKIVFDRQQLIKACKFISEMDDRFFGGLPYHRYVWFFSPRDSADGGSGLEHLNGTEISFAKTLAPRTIGVLSHEYFHLWNVKRIRAKVLGPFDYTQLPQTGALWWLEGVTDYYSHSLLRRNGWYDDKLYYAALARNIDSTRANPARMQISAYDASYRVREANNGVGNSRGYLVSYYDTGWLIGMCLDIELLSQTHGKHSLDDIVRALWRECRNNQPGFQEDEIRNLCVKYGGPSLGTLYDTIVLKPGELPVETQLAKVGLRAEYHVDSTPDLGIHAFPSFEKRQWIVTAPSPGGELQANDVLTSIGGVSLTDGAGWMGAYATGTSAAAIGQPLPITLIRNGMTMNVTITPTPSKRKSYQVMPDDAASPEAIALREKWLSAKR